MRRVGQALAALCIVITGGACTSGASLVGPMRFANEPIVWQVNDRKSVAKPKSRTFIKELYFFDASFFRRMTLALEVRRPTRARDVNALGEVPDSTWFVNRIGKRALTVAAVSRGPNEYAGPDLSQPWRVTGLKTGGTSVGLVIKDARGIKYLIKFDPPTVPVVETAAHVVIQRLLWAAGYNVPHDSIVYVDRKQFGLDPGAKTKDAGGRKRPLSKRDIDDAMGKVHKRKDGRIRVLASRFLSGVPLGGFVPEGTRSDDANDSIAHEQRRSLRGMYLLYAWLDQIDIKKDNTLDMWVTDPADPKVHYVMHYLVDFGKGLGGMNLMLPRPDSGFTYNFDIESLVRYLPLLGMSKRPWEGARYSGIPGVGRVNGEQFQPNKWRGVAMYLPFLDRDPYDMLWATKIIMSFSTAHIRAAVQQGKFEDPRAVPYLTKTLVERQRKIGRYFLSRMNTADGFEARAQTVCFRDLLVAHGVATAAEAASTSYLASTHDYSGRALGWQRTLKADKLGNLCAGPLTLGTSKNAYTILKLVARRGRARFAPVEVHLANRDGKLRVLGVNRR